MSLMLARAAVMAAGAPVEALTMREFVTLFKTDQSLTGAGDNEKKAPGVDAFPEGMVSSGLNINITPTFSGDIEDWDFTNRRVEVQAGATVGRLGDCIFGESFLTPAGIFNYLDVKPGGSIQSVDYNTFDGPNCEGGAGVAILQSLNADGASTTAGYIGEIHNNKFLNLTSDAIHPAGGTPRQRIYHNYFGPLENLSMEPTLWDSGTTYAEGELTTDADGYPAWASIADGNLNNPLPETHGSNAAWQLIDPHADHMQVPTSLGEGLIVEQNYHMRTYGERPGMGLNNFVLLSRHNTEALLAVPYGPVDVDDNVVETDSPNDGFGYPFQLYDDAETGFNGLFRFRRNFIAPQSTGGYFHPTANGLMDEWSGNKNYFDEELIPGPTIRVLAAPLNTTPASIAGDTGIGDTLTATPGVWTGQPVPTITGQWRRDGVAIGGETALTYDTVEADDGTTVTYLESASNNQGADTQASNGIAVADAVEPIAITSASVRFPEKNNTVEKAGAARLLVPQFAPGTDPMWAADGGFIACIEAPWRSYGRPISGLSYGAEASNGVLGNSNTASGATAAIGILLRAPADSYATSYKVVVTASGSTNRTVTLDIPLGTAPEPLTVCARLVGSDLFAESYSAGALVAGSGALGAPGSSGLRSGGIPLGALGALGATPSNFVGHFHGAVGFFGWIDATVSQADMEAISGGADPYTQLSGWRWAKKLTDETDLTPDYDTLDVGDMTVVGTGFMPGGDVLPAADGANRFSVKPIPFGYVWGCMPGEAAGTIRLSGTASGVTGEVEARYYNSDGTLVMDWTTLTGSTIAAGVWAGTAASPRGSGWGYIDVRPVSAPGMMQRIRNECGVGWKISVLGQSNSEGTFVTGLADDVENRTDPAAAVSLIGHQRIYSAPLLGSAPQTGKIFMKPLTALHPVADGAAAASRILAGYTDAPICLVALTHEGTAIYDLTDDSIPDRTWSDVEDMLAICGNDLSLHLWQWNTAPIASVNQTGGGVGNSLNPMIDGDAFTGIGPYDRDHYFRDGTFEGQAPWAFGVSNRRIGGEMSDVFDNSDSDSANVGVHALIWNKAMVSYADSNSFEYAFGTDVKNDADLGHQEIQQPWGYGRMGWRMGYAMARGLTFAADTFPAIGATVRSGDTITVAVTTPNGGTLQTGWSIAGVTPDADWPTVSGFEVSEDSGVTWSNGNTETGTAATEFSAEITGANEVTLTHLTGTWAANTRIRYLHHGPLNYGRAKEDALLMLGVLYEGDGDGLGSNPALAAEDGIGLPVAPLWSTAGVDYVVAA